MKKRLLAGILALSMAGALLTGCGKGSSKPSESTGAETTEAAAEQTERAKANEIVIGIPQDLEHRMSRSPKTVSPILLPFATA